MTEGPPRLPDGLGAPRAVRRLSGGMISDVWRATIDAHGPVVVKSCRYDARLEADGLRALAGAGAPVPQVIAVDEDVLVIEEVAGPSDWPALGEALAQVHQRTDPATGDRFGWHHDNVIGPLPQHNEPDDDWPRFFAEHRLRCWLDADGLPVELRRRLEAAADGPLLELLDHDAPPSLVHGDLWSGNVVAGRWLIDPAVHHADRELDLAMMDLFGGFPEACWQAYRAAWPLDDGWERRRLALQLHYLLVHVELFGRGYLGGVQERLDRLGW